MSTTANRQTLVCMLDLLLFIVQASLCTTLTQLVQLYYMLYIYLEVQQSLAFPLRINPRQILSSMHIVKYTAVNCKRTCRVCIHIMVCVNYTGNAHFIHHKLTYIKSGDFIYTLNLVNWVTFLLPDVVCKRFH